MNFWVSSKNYKKLKKKSISRLYRGYIAVISRLYRGYIAFISCISQLYRGYIAVISRLYRSYIAFNLIGHLNIYYSKHSGFYYCFRDYVINQVETWYMPRSYNVSRCRILCTICPWLYKINVIGLVVSVSVLINSRLWPWMRIY